MLYEDCSKHTEPYIELRYIAKGVDLQDASIGSLNTLEMHATCHMMKPTVRAPLCSFQSIVMPAHVTPSAEVELHCKRNYIKLDS
jgi:hypothetical protein